MFSIPLLKIKLFTLLSMVIMGLFSRFVLGLPIQITSSITTCSEKTPTHRFPDSGARSSLRFLPAPKFVRKRRRYEGNTTLIEDQIFNSDSTNDMSCFEFIGEILEREESSGFTAIHK